MTLFEAVAGVISGFAAGVLSGAFGVGGGIITTPAIVAFFDVLPIIAVATPLPVILPTALTGAARYRKAGQIDLRAVKWMAGPGMFGAAAGALVADRVNADILLLVTAGLLAWQAVQVARGKQARPSRTHTEVPGWQYGLAGAAAGFVSGLLGVGGGIILVPLLAGVFGMPLKQALGTSLAAIVALVIPGAIVHWALGNIDWAIALVLTVGVVPGARLGARLSLGAGEGALRLAVGVFLILVAVLFAAEEISVLVRT